MSVTATAVGFVGRPEDLRDRVRLCRPVLSLDAQRGEVQLARRLDWGTAERSLKKLDRDELARVATLSRNPDTRARPVDGVGDGLVPSRLPPDPGVRQICGGAVAAGATAS